ncbi:MAG: hypothetical protein F6K04_01465 [Leptolyngbya sp. SIO4C5]|nr:hypothetical protein [Leptolyngbya sp. SIO4C5]
MKASQLSLVGGSVWVGVYPYPSKGRRYWRLQWGEGHRNLGQMHVPGGAVGSAKADARAGELARWIRLGRSLSELQGLIKSWRRSRKKR